MLLVDVGDDQHRHPGDQGKHEGKGHDRDLERTQPELSVEAEIQHVALSTVALMPKNGVWACSFVDFWRGLPAWRASAMVRCPRHRGDRTDPGIREWLESR